MDRTLKILIPVFVIFCIAGGLVLATFSYMNDSTKQIPLAFFNEKKNSMEGIIVGTSSANRFWIPTEAYENHGAVVGCYASHSVPLVSLKYMVEAALENQSPEFIAIEIRNVSKDLQSRKTSQITDLTDHMPATMTRLRYIKAILEFDKENDTEISSDPRKFRYPVSSEEVAKSEGYCYSYSVYKGYPINSATFKRTHFEDSTEWTEECGDITDGNKPYMVELLDYCETLDCDVIFFASPCALNPNRQKVLNKALEMASERGFKTRNFNTDDGLEKMNLEEKDFYNDRHTNVYGAIKFTEYMYQYLDELYSLEDHSGEKDYESWDTAAELFRSDVRAVDPDISFDVR